MNYILAGIMILMFSIVCYLALQFYMKANIGKEKGEVIVLNKYLYGSLIYSAVATFIVAVVIVVR